MDQLSLKQSFCLESVFKLRSLYFTVNTSTNYVCIQIRLISDIKILLLDLI